MRAPQFARFFSFFFFFFFFLPTEDASRVDTPDERSDPDGRLSLSRSRPIRTRRAPFLSRSPARSRPVSLFSYPHSSSRQTLPPASASAAAAAAAAAVVVVVVVVVTLFQPTLMDRLHTLIADFFGRKASSGQWFNRCRGGGSRQTFI
jgi:hypothetical protein